MLRRRVAGVSYAEIAKAAGVSPQRIQQILSPPTAVRKQVIATFSGDCARCGLRVGNSGQVHHLGARNGEDWNDLASLQLLCLGCHAVVHFGRKALKPFESIHVLEAIERLTKEHDFPPTLQEIAHALGVPFTSVYNRLLRLRREGRVAWTDRAIRTLRVVKK